MERYEAEYGQGEWDEDDEEEDEEEDDDEEDSDDGKSFLCCFLCVCAMFLIWFRKCERHESHGSLLGKDD